MVVPWLHTNKIQTTSQLTQTPSSVWVNVPSTDDKKLHFSDSIHRCNVLLPPSRSVPLYSKLSRLKLGMTVHHIWLGIHPCSPQIRQWAKWGVVNQSIRDFNQGSFSTKACSLMVHYGFESIDPRALYPLFSIMGKHRQRLSSLYLWLINAKKSSSSTTSQ